MNDVKPFRFYMESNIILFHMPETTLFMKVCSQILWQL